MQLEDLTRCELLKLIKALCAHARIVSVYLPDLFDSADVEDVVQEALCQYLAGKFNKFDGHRGSLTAFLKTVVEKKILTRARRASRADPLPDEDESVGPATRASAPARAHDDSRVELANDIRRFAQEDKEIEKLLTAIDQLQDQPPNIDQRIASNAHESVGWVRNKKRRLQYKFRGQIERLKKKVRPPPKTQKPKTSSDVSIGQEQTKSSTPLRGDV